MSYNMKELPHYINTAGKITVITSLIGVVVFAFAFLLNIGVKELHQANAQEGVASTSVTVLNTPPLWTVNAQEVVESSQTNPTNSGTQVSWSAVATDSNGEDYYLLVCSTGDAPTANAGSAPTCNVSGTQWAVSAQTASEAVATAATTTTEIAPFVEENDWFAFICDSVGLNPRCNTTSMQGTGTSSSPFNVNKRPTFTVFTDDSPTLPGAVVTFSSTAADTDVVPTADTVKLIVCSSTGFDTVTDTCDDITLASSTAASNPNATYTVTIPMQDQNYPAYGFVVDNHGHEATGGTQGTDSVMTIANAAPTVDASTITLNGGSDIALAVEAGETTGFDLQFIAADNNSCENVSETPEIIDYVLSVYRSGVGTTTCDGTVGSYNANNCYPSEVATTTWNLNCTLDGASCGGANDVDQIWNCTFPLWYVAEPTSETASDTPYFNEDWRAAVAAIDDNNATGTYTQSSTGDIDLLPFLSVALDVFAIPYGQLEPGDQTDPLAATTSIIATGNVGVDELLTGESMCTTYTTSVTCPTSATSTIAEHFQVFATSTLTYAQATATGATLSSTTQKELEVNVPKSISTSTPAQGLTYWGIKVPATITLAGSYTGENTFFGKASEPIEW